MNPLRHCSSLQKTGLVGKQSRCQKEGPQEHRRTPCSWAWATCQQYRGGRAPVSPDSDRPRWESGLRRCWGRRAVGGGQPGPLLQSTALSLPRASHWDSELHQPLASPSGRCRDGRVDVSSGLEVKRGELLLALALQPSPLG